MLLLSSDLDFHLAHHVALLYPVSAELMLPAPPMPIELWAGAIATETLLCTGLTSVWQIAVFCSLGWLAEIWFRGFFSPVIFISAKCISQLVFFVCVGLILLKSIWFDSLTLLFFFFWRWRPGARKGNGWRSAWERGKLIKYLNSENTRYPNSDPKCSTYILCLFLLKTMWSWVVQFWCLHLKPVDKKNECSNAVFWWKECCCGVRSTVSPHLRFWRKTVV